MFDDKQRLSCLRKLNHLSLLVCTQIHTWLPLLHGNLTSNEIVKLVEGGLSVRDIFDSDRNFLAASTTSLPPNRCWNSSSSCKTRSACVFSVPSHSKAYSECCCYYLDQTFGPFTPLDNVKCKTLLESKEWFLSTKYIHKMMDYRKNKI